MEPVSGRPLLGGATMKRVFQIDARFTCSRVSPGHWLFIRREQDRHPPSVRRDWYDPVLSLMVGLSSANRAISIG